MRNNKPSKPTPDPVAMLLEELKMIIHHDRAADVFLNEWLHDGDVPMPSNRLVLYLARRFLSGSIVEMASETELPEVINAALAYLRSETDEDRVVSIRLSTDFFESLRHEASSKKFPQRHEWWWIVESFLFPPDDVEVATQAGTRLVARRFLETLLLRALFTLDTERLNGLAAAMSMIASQGSPCPTNSNRFAALILRARPHIEAELGFPPSKEQTKNILLGCFHDLPDDTKAWTAASNMVPWPSKDRQGRRIPAREMDAIISLMRNRLKIN